MANNGRSAEKTIKGYYYQFDYSIIKVLELPDDNDTICIEGVEDVDITDESNVIFHQCKCYESSEYVHSKITPAWNCQEMCSRGIPKIMDRQESGGVMRELL